MEKMIAPNRIGEVIHGAEQQLIRQGYSTVVIHDNKYVWGLLSDYADKRGISEYTLKTAWEFGKEVYQIDILNAPVRGNRRVARALRVLEDYHHLGYIRRRVYTRDLTNPPEYQELCENVVRRCHDEGMAECTLRQLQRCLNDYTWHLHEQGIKEIGATSHEQVVSFLRRQGNSARGTVDKKLYLLQRMYRHAHDMGLCSTEMVVKFPRLTHVSQKKVPSTMTKEDIHRMLSCIDRENALGKRDYAILLLAAQLGIRAGDIRELKLENILWEDKRIEFAQGKTGNPISLPLLPETGWALIDYLQKGRPDSGSRHVFLRHLRPHLPFGKCNNLHSVITKYMHMAGIQVSSSSKHGLHALRHSLAGAMLSQNVALPVISSVLGHSSTQSTTVYLRVDTEHMRECALEVTL